MSSCLAWSTTGRRWCIYPKSLKDLTHTSYRGPVLTVQFIADDLPSGRSRFEIRGGFPTLKSKQVQYGPSPVPYFFNNSFDPLRALHNGIV